MNLERIEGQPRALRCLISAIAADRIGNAYLFSGPPGVGKRTAAFAFARALACAAPPEPGSSCGKCSPCGEIEKGIYPDLRVVGPEEGSASRRAFHVEGVAEAAAWAALTAYRGRFKVCIMESVHQMTAEAANRFLKVLEEPPGRMVWILITEEPLMVPETIRSRCQRVGFGLLPRKVARDIMRERGGGDAEAALAAELGEIPENMEEKLACRREARRILGLAEAGDLSGLVSAAMGFGRKQEREGLPGLLRGLEEEAALRLRAAGDSPDRWISALTAIGRARSRLKNEMTKTLMDALGAELFAALGPGANG